MRSLISYSFMFLAERLSPPVLRVGLSLASKQMGSEYPTLHVFFGCGVCAPLRQAAYIDLAGHIQVQAQDSLQKPPVQHLFAKGPLEQGLMPDPDLVAVAHQQTHTTVSRRIPAGFHSNPDIWTPLIQNTNSCV